MKKQKQSVDIRTVRHFLDIGKRYKEHFYWIWLTPLSAMMLTIAIPYFVGRILAALANPDSNLIPDIIGLAVSSILAVLVNRFAFLHYLRWQAKVMGELQVEGMEMLLKRSVDFHNNRVGGKLIADALEYPNAFLKLSDSVFVSILPFTVVILSGITLVTIHAPLIGLVIAVMSAIAIGSAVHFRLSMKDNRERRIKARNAVAAHVGDTITNIQTVKTFGREVSELRSHHRYSKELLDARLHDWTMLANNGNNRIIALVIFELIFVITIVFQVRSDPALLATGIFAFSYTITLTNRLFEIGNMMRSVEESLLLAEPMTEMLGEDVEIVDLPDAAELKVGKGEIKFNDVYFKYADNMRNGDVFHAFTLDIKPGEKVGLVGPSGGGKTTFTKLLLRFQDLAGGSITIDGQNIADVSQPSLRRAIAYVPQEPLLFHRTIKENISYGSEKANIRDIVEASKRAHAHEFIENLPDGYDTVVGERGVKLSGGQRQRVAIARAILKDAPILVLDEATSALDSASEKAIQSALAELMEDKTTIVIAHRLSTIQRLDRIVVLDDGKILEEGSHNELLKKDGLYAKLWSHQSGGFLEEQQS
jgi:ATP-binding cassette subfamily B protein